MILKDLRRLPKIDAMLILKRKEIHSKGIQKSIKKPLKPIIVSTENKYVVKNVLRPPNEGLVKSYAEGIFNDLLQNFCLTLKLCKEFPSYTKKLSNKMKARTACRLAARNIVHETLSLRKTNTGKLLKHVR